MRLLRRSISHHYIRYTAAGGRESVGEDPPIPHPSNGQAREDFTRRKSIMDKTPPPGKASGSLPPRIRERSATNLSFMKLFLRQGSYYNMTCSCIFKASENWPLEETGCTQPFGILRTFTLVFNTATRRPFCRCCQPISPVGPARLTCARGVLQPLSFFHRCRRVFVRGKGTGLEIEEG